jgi:hypothetical protein
MEHAVFYLKGRRFTNTHGWRRLFTGAQPLVDQRPKEIFLVLCIQDAPDPIPSGTEPILAEWANAVKKNGWWVWDEAGRRISGWGVGRFAVDLSNQDACEWLISHTTEVPPGYTAYHWDDASLQAQIPGVEKVVVLETWRQNMAELLQELPESDSINGGKDWLAPDNGYHCQHVKYEFPRYHAPWGDRPGHPMAWRTWVFGDKDFGPGLDGMTRNRLDVTLDVFMPNAWDLVRKVHHAEVMICTALLFDRTYVMFHSDTGDWANGPVWYPMCGAPAQLGKPVNHMSYTGTMWQRPYEHGTVLVDPMGVSAKIVWATT